MEQERKAKVAEKKKLQRKAKKERLKVRNEDVFRFYSASFYCRAVLVFIYIARREIVKIIGAFCTRRVPLPSPISAVKGTQNIFSSQEKSATSSPKI